jgi:mono/diheme cytochrome c family protein
MSMAKRLFAVAAAFAFVAGLSASAVLAQGKGDAAAGKAIYEKECVKCHGAAGAGDGPQGQKLKDKPTNWTSGGGGLKGMDDAKIFESIHKGGKAIGKSAAMPAYPKMSEADVWNVVAYVKTLQK